MKRLPWESRRWPTMLLICFGILSCVLLLYKHFEDPEVQWQAKAMSALATMGATMSGLGTARFNRFFYDLMVLPPISTPWTRVYDLNPINEAGGVGVPVTIRVWMPSTASAETPLPLFIFIHGGGFVICRGIDAVAERIARRFVDKGFAVASIDYRLGPEAPFPAAVEDVSFAMEYIMKGGLGPGVDLQRVGVLGESAGGNLAAVASMLLRDHIKQGDDTLVLPKWQILVYPAFPLANNTLTQSRQRLTDAYFLTTSMLRRFETGYLGGPNEDTMRQTIQKAAVHPEWLNPMYSPLGLAGMPPTYMVTAGRCPLQDEAKLVADKLQGAGVTVLRKHLPTMTHGFIVWDSAEKSALFNQVAQLILGSSDPPTFVDT